MVSESDIEYGFIGKLQELKYTFRPDIHDRAALEKNFREKFEALNRVKLSDAEFYRLRDEIVSPDPFAAAKTLRSRNTFIREDGTPLQYTLVNIKDWCKNDFEVVSQLRMNTESSHHRYDVILLMNGIPVVQIELKTLDVTPRKAMKQIADYKHDHGASYNHTLLCFIQLFIVSNRTNTYYLANNRKEHFNFSADEQFLPVYQLADEDNKKITHLTDFAEKALHKCTLAETISRYMVLVESEGRLLVMRPYQVYAVKAIVECIHQNRGNGYIWHTTGSGKTLTSFKASTLLKDNPDIDKCLFVVDRKDLDRQTREEFNKFQEGCVEENTNTESLVRRLLSTDYADKVIVTTIQKLGIALDASGRRDYAGRLEPLRHSRMAIIFDECHRSQFGDNHKAIKAFFPRAQLFGFTGTPIFEDNAAYTRVDNGTEAKYQTTEDIFQKRLHAYTITHAIEDKNVLRFHVDYYKAGLPAPPGEGPGVRPPGEAVTQAAVVDAILEKHDAATHGRRFNAVLATQSIAHAIEYYRLFAEAQAKRAAEDETYQPLHIACVFSPPAEGNRDVQQLQEDLQQEREDNKTDPDAKKAALARIIADYNERYGTNHSIGEFDQYYQDVQGRIKAQKWPLSDYPRRERIDITIVVDMLLTGFDSKYLNTLYVDKALKHHGLIQAFSRTNRVLNDTKPYGNILDFRGQEAAVDAAIQLFSGVDGGRAREIWLVDPAPVVLKKYEEAVQRLGWYMQSQGLSPAPEEVANLKGDAARAGFIEKFKEVQRLRTQLEQYTDLGEAEQAKLEAVLPPDELRAFRGAYLDTARALQAARDKKDKKKESPEAQLDFELVLFSSAVIDYDYIMRLMAASMEGSPSGNDKKKVKMTREQILALLASSANLMDEREDMSAYFAGLPGDRGLTEAEIREGYERYKLEKESGELARLAGAHGLDAAGLTHFAQTVAQRALLDSEALGELMRPLGLGWKARAAAEGALMTDLIPVLKKMAGGRDISGMAAYE